VALSATSSVAVALPVAEGVKLTDIAQLAPAARDGPHSLLSAKSARLAPASVMPLTASVAVPGLDSVMVWLSLVVPTVVPEKLRLVGLSVACGAAAATPVPERAAVCGDVPLLSATLIAALRAPAAPGVKLTEMLQLALAAKVLPQVLVS
jgi:hypothetical protein